VVIEHGEALLGGVQDARDVLVDLIPQHNVCMKVCTHIRARVVLGQRFPLDLSLTSCIFNPVMLPTDPRALGTLHCNRIFIIEGSLSLGYYGLGR
jgi:hypothetical protein